MFGLVVLAYVAIAIVTGFVAYHVLDQSSLDKSQNFDTAFAIGTVWPVSLIAVSALFLVNIAISAYVGIKRLIIGK